MELELTTAVGAVAPEWSALADAVSAPPFLRPGWTKAWWHAFGSGALVVATLRDDGRLVALLPLSWHRGSLRTPTNVHTPQFGPLAEDRSSAYELARGLFDRTKARVAVAYVDPARPEVDALRSAAADAGRLVHVRTLQRSPYVPTAGRERAEYERTLSPNLRGSLNRTRRRLEEQGPLSVDVSDGGEGFDDLLAEGLAVEASGWKGTRGTAIATSNETRRFYTAVAQWAAAREILRLSFLRLDGRAIAFDLGLEDAGAYYSLKAGYDEAFRKFGPGRLLSYELVARAFARGLARYEFCGDAEPYKLAFATEVRECALVEAYPPSPVGAALFAAQQYARPVARRARRAIRRLQRRQAPSPTRR